MQINLSDRCVENYSSNINFNVLHVAKVSEENLSARPMCPGGHIFLGNYALLDGKYCQHQANMSGGRRKISPPGKCDQA